MAKERAEKSRDCHSFTLFLCNGFAHRGWTLSPEKRCLEGEIRLEFRRTYLSLRWWFPKCVPHTSSISIIRELVRNAGSWAPSQSY